MSQFDDLVKRYDELDTRHEQLKRDIREIEDQKEDIRRQALAKLREVGAQKLRSAPFDIEVKPKRVYKANDWGTFSDWIFDNRRLDVLQKRISVTTLDDVAEEDGLPPGVEKMEWDEAHFKRVSKTR